jgi:hypothetical protein
MKRGGRRALYWAITLSHAARAGAQYGAQSSGKAGDSAGIQQAALQEAQNIERLASAHSASVNAPAA